MQVYLISLTALSPPKLFSNKNVKETKKKKKNGKDTGLVEFSTTKLI